ncbi:bacillithiol system redox-active protein YtxJ [Flavobacterium sp.]|uniref:bacillithiol system redox-active protein YtxJ n=1 Tax=Flavobacterium sp. TaxID=239 RepID=UPI002613650B|nr:bacillithiol system redox-active protein YtxJ [Flavobacterium sp.]
MGFFSNSVSEDTTSWIALTDAAQLEDSGILVILKHSTRCIVSKTVLKELNRSLEFANATFLYLDLLQYRSISNHIAEKYGIQHESPQLLVVTNGKVVYSASHSSIDAEVINRILHQ